MATIRHLPRQTAALALGAALAGAACAGPGARHVVIVSVDGFRADAIAAAPAPAIAALGRSGRLALDAQAVDPTVTLPNHLAMVTGLLPRNHGVTSNGNLAADITAPTIFGAARAAGLRTGLYYGKSKLSALAPGASADVRYGPAPGEKGGVFDAAAVAARFVADLPRERFGLAFVHLRDADYAGHTHGWMGPEYLAAVRAVDAAVGRLAQAIADSGLGGSTVLLLTADHGGHGDDHYDGTDEDRIIPFLCQGAGVKPGPPPAAARNMDAGPTALAVLGLPPLPHADGRALAECLGR